MVTLPVSWNAVLQCVIDMVVGDGSAALTEMRRNAPSHPDRSGSHMTMVPYLEPTEASAVAFVKRGIRGEVVMLNLLRFRATADYAAHPDLAPDNPISGAEAFDLYINHTLPFLRESGGDLLMLAVGGPLLIGPPEERWDLAMLVQ